MATRFDWDSIPRLDSKAGVQDLLEECAVLVRLDGEFAERRSKVRWALADRLVMLRQRRVAWEQLSTATGLSESALKQLRRLAEAFPPEARVPVPVEHHQAVIRLGEDARKAVLHQADDEGWDLARVRKEARRLWGEEPIAVLDLREHEFRCPRCGHQWDGDPYPDLALGGSGRPDLDDLVLGEE